MYVPERCHDETTDLERRACFPDPGSAEPRVVRGAGSLGIGVVSPLNKYKQRILQPVP